MSTYLLGEGTNTKEKNEDLDIEKAVKGAASVANTISRTGWKVLVLLAFQNCFKNLLTHYVMGIKKPEILLSAAVVGSELTKISLSILYVLVVDRDCFSDIFSYMRQEWWKGVLLVVPASTYNLQQTLEYVALTHLDAAKFSVLVQSKLLATALFAVVILRKRLMKKQVLSLILLTVGVILCASRPKSDVGKNDMVGVIATLSIALSSGFASVYTEKVIKGKKTVVVGMNNKKQYSLAYTQIQLASVSLVVMGAYSIYMDRATIESKGLWMNFDRYASVCVVSGGIGGLVVAAVLKYADSLLKGYATAVSVLMSGVFSVILFGTTLDEQYGMGVVVVLCAIFMYNATDLDRVIC